AQAGPGLLRHVETRFGTSNGGDCEDYAIAKYVALRAAGVPAANLRLIYVKALTAQRIENHMVLAWYASAGAEPLRRPLPQYVKIDASLSQGLEAGERRFQVEALVRAARSLDVPVWAQVFDAPGALELLAEMGVVGAQGYALAAERTASTDAVPQ
ncbi:MAG: EAL domain-containing protein, partial [Sulfuritalea sp.]|nr:EAL domain-containing protein [Sulfuritalea sp.]